MPFDAPEEFHPLAPSASQVPSPTPPIGPHPIPWSLRDLGLFLLFAPFALALANLAAAGGYHVLRVLHGWEGAPSSLPRNTFFLLAFQLIFSGLLLSFVYALVVFHYRQPFWSGLKWRRPSTRQMAWSALGGVVLAFAIQLAPNLLPETPDFPLRRMFTSPAAGYAIGAYSILIAPWVEEVIFRGFLFGVFERRAGLWTAIILTALFFGGLHVPEYWGAWNHVILISLVGLTFSLARGISGSLATSVILHLAYNTSLIAALFFQTQGFQNIR